jgi:hypothetical protein
MSEETTTQGSSRTAPTGEGAPIVSTVAQLEKDREAIRVLVDEQQRQSELAAEAEKARAVRAEMCSYLLDSALASSRLPAPVAERVRKQFAGKVFEAHELSEAIMDARQLVSELTASATVTGPQH